jgi:murein DD-endopeptidase MepM/ murein hydrolase activator NlpD
MSSAKRTPRYVDAIRSFEVVERNMTADVIRLRPEPLGPALPPITEHWPRARAIPLARRPWQLLLVPPTPGAATRTYNVARWQARLVLGALVALLLIAIAGASTIVVAVRSPEVFTSDETETLRSRLLVVEDSLALALSALAEPADSVGMPVASVLAGKAATASAPATRRTAKLLTPSLKPSPRRSEPSVDGDRSIIEGLPVIGAIASRFSRTRRHPLLHVIRPHLGVDVAAPRGTQITAPAPGRVAFVGRKFGFGLVVELDHGNGVTTRYAHCGSALVTVGTHVERGTALATVGTSGLSTGPHLHYEVLVNGRQVDPLRYKLAQPNAEPAAPAAASATSPAPVAATAAQTPAPIAAPPASAQASPASPSAATAAPR